jgi:hypothetical protein
MSLLLAEKQTWAEAAAANNAPDARGQGLLEVPSHPPNRAAASALPRFTGYHIGIIIVIFVTTQKNK